MDALSDNYETWVLRCDSQNIFLYRYEQTEYHVERHHALHTDISPSSHRSTEYDRYVSFILLEFAFELVHIRHIGWHSIGLFDLCRNLEIPVVFSFHDFYTVCPTVKLLDEEQTFCEGTCTARPGPCKAELWRPNSMPPLKHNFVQRWKRMMKAALATCDAYVTTAASARDVILRNYTFLNDADFRIIPHGRSTEAMHAFAEIPSPNSVLRVLVPGNISAAKGADLYIALSKLAPENSIELHILGDAGKVPECENVKLHGRYKREEFAQHVAKIRPHIGAVFSIWPETYCHTLTEMWMCGLPVAVFDIGAVGERVGQHGAGWLLDVKSTAEDLISFFTQVKNDQKDYSDKLSATISWQSSYGLNYNTHFMALLYNELYVDVFARRRAFKRQVVLPAASNERTFLLSDPGDDSPPRLLPAPRASGSSCLQVPSSFPLADGALPPPSDIIINDKHLSDGRITGTFQNASLPRINWLLDLTSCTQDVNVIMRQIDSFCSDASTRNIGFVGGGASFLNSLLRRGLPRCMTEKAARLGRQFGEASSGSRVQAVKVARDRNPLPKRASVSIILEYNKEPLDCLLTAISRLSSQGLSVAEIIVVDFSGELLERSLFEIAAQHCSSDIKILTANDGDSERSLVSEVLDICNGEVIWWVGGDYSAALQKVGAAIEFFTTPEVGLVQYAAVPRELNPGDMQAWPARRFVDGRFGSGAFPAAVARADLFKSFLHSDFGAFVYGFDLLTRKTVIRAGLEELPETDGLSLRVVTTGAALAGACPETLVVSLSI